MEDQLKIKIEIEEIEDPELAECRYAFTSYNCKIYADGDVFEVDIRGVNRLKGPESILHCLKNKIYSGKEDPDEDDD
jgi:hypothetical protein